MNWLITGGCGFIGRSLLRQLRTRSGLGIRVVDNLTVGSREELGAVVPYTEITKASPEGPATDADLVELIVGDILDEELARQVTRGIDVVVHLAANTGVAPSVADPRMDCVTNVLGTLNYLEAARHNGARRFIFASSGAPAGECEPPIHEELPPHPVSPYGASKLAGEGYCSAYFHSFGVETVALRFSNVYGPLSSKKDSVVARFIKRALAGKALEIYGDGTQTRDFLYIDDLVRAILLAADLPGIGGETFQIATAREITVGETAERIATLVRSSTSGLDVTINYEHARAGDVQRNFSDTTKAKEVLGWQAEVQLDEGLQRTLDWFLKNPTCFS